MFIERLKGSLTLLIYIRKIIIRTKWCFYDRPTQFFYKDKYSQQGDYIICIIDREISNLQCY